MSLRVGKKGESPAYMCVCVIKWKFRMEDEEVGVELDVYLDFFLLLIAMRV